MMDVELIPMLPYRGFVIETKASVLTRKFAYEISLVFSAGSSSLFGHNATRRSLIAPRSDQKSFAIFRKELLGQHTSVVPYVLGFGMVARERTVYASRLDQTNIIAATMKRSWSSFKGKS